MRRAMISQSIAIGNLFKLAQNNWKPDDTNARAYAAVMGVDWSKVKSWREVDGAIEFEME